MIVSAPVDYNSNLNILYTVLLIIGIIAIALHIFQAFALYNISKNRGYTKPWLSFIPIVNSHVLGGIYDNITMHKRAQLSAFSSNVNMTGVNIKKSYYRIILLVFNIGVFLMPVIFYWSLISLVIKMTTRTTTGAEAIPFVLSSLLIIPLVICFAVFSFIALYGIYSDYSPSNPVILLILSVLFPYIAPILLFSICTNQSVTMHNLNMQQQYAQQYGQQQPQYPASSSTISPQ